MVVDLDEQRAILRKLQGEFADSGTMTGIGYRDVDGESLLAVEFDKFLSEGKEVFDRILERLSAESGEEVVVVYDVVESRTLGKE